MKNRSFLLAMGLAALFSLAFTPGSQAASVLVTTTVDFHVTGGGTASDLEITYNPTGLSITDLMYTATDGLVSPGISSSASTVTLTFDPKATASGVVFTFMTDAAPGDIGVASYQLTGLDGHVTDSGVNVGLVVSGVPEPASVALLGIGMAGFLAFRRFRKRLTVA
jgi:PEP-CTERM motif